MPKKNSSDKKQKWLRLLEVIVVLVVFVFLLSLAYILADMNRTQARDAERISQADHLRTALQFHYLDKGYYPIHTEWCSLEADCDTLLKEIEPYLSWEIKDPLYPKEEYGRRYSYQYRTTVNGQDYKIHVELEEKGPYELGSKNSFTISPPL
jgi:type II secretory pathway pseudopilin PulG